MGNFPLPLGPEWVDLLFGILVSAAAPFFFWVLIAHWAAFGQQLDPTRVPKRHGAFTELWALSGGREHCAEFLAGAQFGQLVHCFLLHEPDKEPGRTEHGSSTNLHHGQRHSTSWNNAGVLPRVLCKAACTVPSLVFGAGHYSVGMPTSLRQLRGRAPKDQATAADGWGCRPPRKHVGKGRGRHCECRHPNGHSVWASLGAPERSFGGAYDR